MPIDPALRSLDLALPACPAAVLALSALMARDEVQAQALAEVVERDMALAAAVMRTVNSAMFGILRRVETVAEAVVFLGMRQVAAITCEAGLRASFPASPAMNALWDQARQRSALMGRCAEALGVHPWRAQSAGLFAQVGQAALMAHDARRYAAMIWSNDGSWHDRLAAQAAAERASFGVDHAVLGSALCRAWGLAAPIADHVRDRPLNPAAWLSRPRDVRELLSLGALADACLAGCAEEADAAGLAGLSGQSAAQVLARVQSAADEWRERSQRATEPA